jgi:hypothetical protein
MSYQELLQHHNAANQSVQPIMSFEAIAMNQQMAMGPSQMNARMPAEFNINYAGGYKSLVHLPDQEELRLYNQWAKLCELSDLYGIEENQNYVSDQQHLIEPARPKKTVDKYLNYLMNVSDQRNPIDSQQPQQVNSPNNINKAVNNNQTSNNNHLNKSPDNNNTKSNTTTRPIFQHDKVKHSQKKQQFVQDNRQLVGELAIYAAAKKGTT